jgi:Na+/melibiose symporter-like transporter
MPDKLPWSRLLLYAAPAPAVALLGLPLNVYLPAFWAQEMAVDLGAVGLVLALVRLLDIVIDPAIGHFSDRLGRRKPFMMAALPIGIAGGALLFFPPSGASAAWLFCAYAVLTVGWSLLSLPWLTWGAELSDDYAERTRITGWRETGTLVGIIASALIPAALAISDPSTVLHVLGVVATILVVPAVLALVARVPEVIRPAARAAAGTSLAGLKSLAANGPFVRLLAAWLVNGIANGLPAALFLLLCRHVLREPAIAGPALLTYFVAGIAFVPLWTRLAGRVGKHRAWSAAMTFSCVAFAPVLLLGAGDGLAFIVICVFSGAGLGADLALPPAMQADVIDLDVLNTGRQRAGLFFAAWTMAQKAGNAFAAGIGLGLLDLFGFSATGENGPGQIRALAMLYCLLPIALKVLAIALVWRFPIDRAEQIRIRAGIATRAAETV